MRSNPNDIYTEAQKAEAIALIREHGAAGTSRKTGIPAGTLRRWKSEAGESGPPRGKDPDEWAKAKEQGAKASWVTANMALKKVRELLKAGEMPAAQKAALVFAILVDKSHLLEVNAAAARTRVLDGEAVAPTFGADFDDEDRLREVTSLLAEIGATIALPDREGDRGDDEGGDDDRTRSPLLLPPAPPVHPDGEQGEVFDDVAGPRRVVRVETVETVVGPAENARSPVSPDQAEGDPQAPLSDWRPSGASAQAPYGEDGEDGEEVDGHLVHVDLVGEQPEPPKADQMSREARIQNDDRWWSR